MTLSVEVLPAPFGPMMARTSPFLMSNDTSRIATTPPNDSDTRSTDSSTSPAAVSLALGALMARQLRRRPPCPGGGRSSECVARSCCLPHRRGDRHRRRIAHLHPRGEDALAAVLEGDLGGNVGLARTV